MTRTLYLTVSGAPHADEPVVDLVRLLQAQGWDITVLSTPMGTRFHDLEAIAEVTGEPVRVEFRLPGTGRSLPPPDVLLACPWSFNSTNRTALGLADNFATALVCEMIGRSTVPVVLVPKAGDALAGHPAWDRSLQLLAALPAVTMLADPDRKLPRWQDVADTLDTLTR